MKLNEAKDQEYATGWFNGPSAQQQMQMQQYSMYQQQQQYPGINSLLKMLFSTFIALLSNLAKSLEFD